MQKFEKNLCTLNLRILIWKISHYPKKAVHKKVEKNFFAPTAQNPDNSQIRMQDGANVLQLNPRTIGSR